MNILHLFALIVSVAHAMPVARDNTRRTEESGINWEGIKQQNDLFEGDLKVPIEMIVHSYNLSTPVKERLLDKFTEGNISIADLDQKAAITTLRLRLWENNIVPYIIHSNYSLERRNELRRAMDHWEEHTCLRFLPLQKEHSYIEFVSVGTTCFSTSIGRRGGRQVINLLPRCTFGFMVHEIGHAIGFWHEQSRPDRDNYLTIHYENVRGGFLNTNFFKRSYLAVDYQGSPYDYKSVMHYPTSWGALPGCKGDACITLSVNNPEEYERQGSPKLGDLKGLSPEDIKQTNRLYLCPKRGIRGFLSIEIKHGYSLRDTDSLWNDPDPYVSLIAVDSRGQKHLRKTHYISNTRNPIWNELIFYGESEWQFFRISVWDDDGGFDDQLSMSQTFPIESGWHRNLKHCENTNCTGYIILNYNFDPRLSRNSSLKIYIRSAHNLRGSDLLWNKPDAYIHIDAVRSNTITQTETSRTVYNSYNPTWNEWINCGCFRWNSFFLQIMDEDIGPDDRLSDKQWVFTYSGVHSNLKHKAYGKGYLTYDYSLTLDKNDCAPNPCRHGGKCSDVCGDYTCLCKHGFVGKQCEHVAGTLKVTARFGRDLPVGQGLWNILDSYIEFKAIDAFQHSERKTTRQVQGSNPIWNEVFVWKYHAWRYLHVRVYDAEIGIDRPLSDQQTFQLSGKGIHRNIRHNCDSGGYVVFDYDYS